MRHQAAFALRFLAATDIALVALSAAGAQTFSGPPTLLRMLLLLLIVPLWMHLFGAFGVYESNRTGGGPRVVRKILSVQITGFVAVLMSFGLTAGLDGLGFALRFAVFSSAALGGEKLLVYLVLPLVRRRGFDRRRVCFVGSWEEAQVQQRLFEKHRDWGLEVVCVGRGTARSRKYYRFSDHCEVADSFEDLIMNEVIDEVVVSARPENIQEERFMLALCAKYGLTGRVRVVESGDPMIPNPGNYLNELLVWGSSERLPLLIWKRTIDLAVCSAALIVLSPLLLIVTALVKLSSPGPVLFRQRRTGRNGRRFVMYKFRTMIDNAESVLHTVNQISIAEGTFTKGPNDWRITHIGGYLRRYSIDEIPQLMNVLKGEMSLVGPRPLPEHQAQKITGAHRRRFSVLPGMTGLWQISGRSDVPFHEWMRFDLEYIDKWSLWLDAKVLLRTLPAVVSGRGAY